MGHSSSTQQRTLQPHTKIYFLFNHCCIKPELKVQNPYILSTYCWGNIKTLRNSLMPRSPDYKQTAKYSGHNRLSESICLQNSPRGGRGANMFPATGVIGIASPLFMWMHKCARACHTRRVLKTMVQLNAFRSLWGEHVDSAAYSRIGSYAPENIYRLSRFPPIVTIRRSPTSFGIT
jgi:hypothetical protein